MIRVGRVALAVELMMFAGCGTTPLSPCTGSFCSKEATDAGASGGEEGDGGTSDGGAADGGAADGGAADGGASDGGPSDGGAADGGTSDGGAADGGALDGGALDAGLADAGQDAGRRDFGPCGSRDGGPGEFGWTVTHEGRPRWFRVFVPPHYDAGGPWPLVLNFHGYSSDPFQQAFFTDTDLLAADAGFIVVYPAGSLGAEAVNGGSLARSWNAGSCCAESSFSGVDDVGFVAAMLNAIESRLCIEPRRIYAMGFSNGGMLSHRLACELSTRIAAVGPVAGPLMSSPCVPARPVPVMHVHGTADNVVPYNGSAFPSFPSVQNSLQAWATRNGCSSTTAETFRQNDSSCRTWQGCQDAGDVVLCTVGDGGHAWPGGNTQALGYTTPYLNASDALWEFFRAHPLP